MRLILADRETPEQRRVVGATQGRPTEDLPLAGPNCAAVKILPARTPDFAFLKPATDENLCLQLRKMRENIASILRFGKNDCMKSVTFPTLRPPPPASIPEKLKKLLGNQKWLQNLGSAAVCIPSVEGLVVTAGCMFFEKSGGLLPGQGKTLARLMKEAYWSMTRTPAYCFTRSAVSFIYGSSPKGGHFFLNVPKAADRSTPVLLLLHGWGGNLLYFPWAVQTEMPECIIIAPSWQIDWTEGSFEDRRDYVEMALAHASDRIAFRLQKPWLVPLSQGGPMAFELAAKLTAKFSGLLGISTMSGNTDHSFPRNFPVRLLHGDADDRIPSDCATETIRTIQGTGGDAKITVISGADHFLTLSHRKQMGEFVRKAIGMP